MLDFAITGLPRSRTAWMAAFMTGDGVSCRHEWLAECKTPDDISGAKVPGILSGISDTCGLLFPEIARRWVIIHRPRRECEVALLKKYGLAVNLADFERRLYDMDGLHIFFNDLSRRDVMTKVWDYCAEGLPFPEQRWQVLKDLRIETTRDGLAYDCGPVVRARVA